MNNCCVCVTEAPEKEKPVDESFAEAVVTGKRERQAVLKRVRRQRATVLKRLVVKYGR